MRTVKSFILIILFPILIFSKCSSEDSSIGKQDSNSPEKLRMELRAIEQAKPQDYLRVESKMKANRVFIEDGGPDGYGTHVTDGYNIEGTITSSASVARFKDVVLTISFKSKTETVLEQQDHVIFEFIEPNSTTPFKLHLEKPEKTVSYSVTVKSATIVE